jgi:hypothetical protein
MCKELHIILLLKLKCAQIPFFISCPSDNFNHVKHFDRIPNHPSHSQYFIMQSVDAFHARIHSSRPRIIQDKFLHMNQLLLIFF